MTVKLTLLLAVLALWGAAAAPAREAQHPDREVLVRELADVRANLAASQTNLLIQQKVILDQQHTIEYGQPEIIQLRAEITALEKQLIEKRKALQVRLSVNPEIKRLEAERKKLFQAIEDLRAQEAVIQREISAAEHASALEQN